MRLLAHCRAGSLARTRRRTRSPTPRPTSTSMAPIRCVARAHSAPAAALCAFCRQRAVLTISLEHSHFTPDWFPACDRLRGDAVLTMEWLRLRAGPAVVHVLLQQRRAGDALSRRVPSLHLQRETRVGAKVSITWPSSPAADSAPPPWPGCPALLWPDRCVAVDHWPLLACWALSLEAASRALLL